MGYAGLLMQAKQSSQREAKESRNYLETFKEEIIWPVSVIAMKGGAFCACGNVKKREIFLLQRLSPPIWRD